MTPAPDADADADRPDSLPLCTIREGADRVASIRPKPGVPLRTLLTNIERLAGRRDAFPGGRLVIDVRGHAVGLGDAERVMLGHHLGQHFRGLKVAVLIDQRTGTGQKAARTLGLDLRAFEDVEEAADWLLEPEPPAR